MNFNNKNNKKLLTFTTFKKHFASLAAIVIITAGVLNIATAYYKKIKQYYKNNIAITLAFISDWGRDTAMELEQEIEKENPLFLGKENPLSIRETKLDFEGRDVIIPENSSSSILNLKQELEEYIDAYYSNKYENTNIDHVDLYYKYNPMQRKR